MTQIALPPKNAYRAPFVAPNDGGRIVVSVRSNIPVSTHVFSEDAARKYEIGAKIRTDSLSSMTGITQGTTFVDVEPGSPFYLVIESLSDSETAEVEFRVKQRRRVKGNDFWLDE